jgi:hypothetical protein
MCEFYRREKLSSASFSQQMKNEIPLPANRLAIARAQLAKFAAFPFRKMTGTFSSHLLNFDRTTGRLTR